jgi:tRNA-specific 2-thiouridylase
VDGEGRVLGRHQGLSGYTVGQRRGLGLSAERPLYVLRIEPAAQRLVVGEESELSRGSCTIERTRWIPFERPGTLKARVRLRSTHGGAEATIHELGQRRAEVRFDEPQRAVTPGQAVVVYDGDLVLGGGWIAA